jgi:hypothetical protein
MNLSSGHFSVSTLSGPNDPNDLVANENEHGQLIAPFWTWKKNQPSIVFLVWYVPDRSSKPKELSGTIQQTRAFFQRPAVGEFCFGSLASAHSCLSPSHNCCSTWRIKVRTLNGEIRERDLRDYDPKKSGNGFANQEQPFSINLYTVLDSRHSAVYWNPKRQSGTAAKTASKPTRPDENQNQQLLDSPQITLDLGKPDEGLAQQHPEHLEMSSFAQVLEYPEQTNLLLETPAPTEPRPEAAPISTMFEPVADCPVDPNVFAAPEQPAPASMDEFMLPLPDVPASPTPDVAQQESIVPEILNPEPAKKRRGRKPKAAGETAKPAIKNRRSKKAKQEEEVQELAEDRSHSQSPKRQRKSKAAAKPKGRRPKA